jgi:heme o synthase
VDFTRRRILAYSIALVPVSLLPCVTGPSGILYGIGALILGLSYVRRAWAFMRDKDDRAAMPLFGYSITYLGVLFALMLADRWLGMLWA